MIVFNFSLTPLKLFSLFFYMHMLIFASESAPTYSAHYCTNQTFFQPKTTFQSNLNALLSYLTSNSSHKDFYITAVGQYTASVVNGLYLCRGDVNARVCQGCVAAAAMNITRLCLNDTESIIWYDVCMLRYSGSTFDNIVPGFPLNDGGSIIGSSVDQFNQLLAGLLNDLAAKSSMSENKFAAGEVGVTSRQMAYGVAQCVPDLTSAECVTYFSSAIAALPSCCNASQGARVLLPGCNIRCQLYPFLYNMTLFTPLVPFPSSGSKSNSVIVASVVPVAILVVLLALGCCWWRRRRSKSHDVVLEARNDFTYEEGSLHFDLVTIEAATNRFSNENKIGQGGFGVVYKGTLPNGQEIAVKRLSRSSLQGDIQFRNEAALVAQLQHRNLVRLLGFCLEGNERILVYEFIPNSSLDRFLFDHEKQGELDWSRRYNIIVGIARGIQYLHEDSRLRIIHRDLKAGNVLLDENMNPKISDFVMAKILHGDQSEVNTRTGRIVGT